MNSLDKCLTWFGLSNTGNNQTKSVQRKSFASSVANLHKNLSNNSINNLQKHSELIENLEKQSKQDCKILKDKQNVTSDIKNLEDKIKQLREKIVYKHTDDRGETWTGLSKQSDKLAKYRCFLQRLSEYKSYEQYPEASTMHADLKALQNGKDVPHVYDDATDERYVVRLGGTW